MITYHVGKKAEPPKPVQLTLFSYGEQYGCKEVWKSADEVLGVSGYAVSSEGRVRGKHGKIMACSWGQEYFSFSVCDSRERQRTIKVHRIVAELFCHKGEGAEVVHHKDGNKKNNAADNLEWTTQAKNMRHWRAMQ